MANLRETIKEISRKHLEENNGVLLGQALTAIGWVNGTVPDCKGVLELSMADVAGAGITVGTAIVGRRPIFVIRFQDFMFLNANPIVMYAAKTKDLFGYGTPIFVRMIANEGGGLGPVHASTIHAIFMHMPGLRVCSPMAPKEYEEIWKDFMSRDDPLIVSEHRHAFDNEEELPDIVVRDADITLFGVSFARFNTYKAAELLEKEGIKCNVVNILWLKPFEVTERLLNPLINTECGLVIDSGYEMAGASQSIAYNLMYASGMPVKGLGTLDNSICVHPPYENRTPTPEKIAKNAKEIIKRRDKNERREDYVLQK